MTRPYMVFDRTGGSQEGAILVFAYTAQQARIMGRSIVSDWTDCRYIDVAARRLGGCEHLKLKDEPHIIDNPPTCSDCDLWFPEPLDENGRCEACAELHAEPAD